MSGTLGLARVSRVRPVLVEAKVNGREPAPLLLDSVGGAVVFDGAYFHEILQRIEAPGDDTNASKAQPFVIKSLRIGDAEFNNVLSVVLDVSDLYEYAGVSRPGILGNNVFPRSRLHLNFKDALLTVDSGGDYRSEAPRQPRTPAMALVQLRVPSVVADWLRL